MRAFEINELKTIKKSIYKKKISEQFF